MTSPVSAPAASSAPATSSAPASTPSSSSSTPATSPSPSTASTSTSSQPANTPNVPGQSQSPNTETAAAVAEEVRKEEERKWKLKVNGKERELTEQELLRRASLAEAAEERFQTAAQKEKQMAEIFEAFMQDPVAIMQELGMDFESLAEARLAEKVRKDLMDPTQRELEELRTFKQQQEEEAARRQQEEQMTVQQRQFEQLKVRAAKEWDTKITEVLQTTDLPADPETVGDVARVLREAMQRGYELDVATAADLVKERYLKKVSSLVAKLDGDKLMNFLGNDFVTKVRKYDLAKLQAQLAQQDPAAALIAQQQEQIQTTPSPSRDRSGQKMNLDDFKAELERQYGVKK